MKHLFVPYELAVLAKEKRFDEPCFGHYVYSKTLFINSNYNDSYNKKEIMPAPLYQQLVDWFREKHKLHIEIDQQDLEGNDSIHRYEYAYRIFKKAKCISEYPNIRGYGEYYHTLNKSLEEAFKLI